MLLVVSPSGLIVQATVSEAADERYFESMEKTVTIMAEWVGYRAGERSARPTDGTPLTRCRQCKKTPQPSRPRRWCMVGI